MKRQVCPIQSLFAVGMNLQATATIAGPGELQGRLEGALALAQRAVVLDGAYAPAQNLRGAILAQLVRRPFARRHRQPALHRLSDAIGIIGVYVDRLLQLFDGPGEFAQNEHAIFISAGRNVLFGHEVHAVS